MMTVIITVMITVWPLRHLGGGIGLVGLHALPPERLQVHHGAVHLPEPRRADAAAGLAVGP